MSEYKVFHTKTGPRYMKDGKFVKVSDVPLAMMGQLATGAKTRSCLFCGEPGTKQRLVTGQSVDLCEQHYYATNIGRIVQQLREKNNGEEHQTNPSQ